MLISFRKSVTIKKMKKTLSDLLKITGLPVLFASLCCLTPIILVVFGLSTVSFAAALTGILDGKYKIVFLGGGITLLIISLVVYFRKRGICTLDQVKKHRNEIVNKVLLAAVAAVIGYVLFFNIFLGVVGSILGIWHGISFAP